MRGIRGVTGAGRRERALTRCSSAVRICGPSWLTLPAPSVITRSPSPACATTAAIAAGKSADVSHLRPADFCGEILRRDAGDWLFTGGIDGQDRHGIGIFECAAELFHQVFRARVAVRLKDHVNVPVSALAGGSKRGANLGGMMAVVVNHGNAAHYAFTLEAPVDAAIVVEPFGDLLRRNFKLARNGHGGCRVQNVVTAGNMQFKRAERPIRSVH